MAKALRWLLALVMLVGAVGAGVGTGHHGTCHHGTGHHGTEHRETGHRGAGHQGPNTRDTGDELRRGEAL